MVQINNSPIIVRVKFRKTGVLAYISHLDLVRTMNRVIVRAKLPLWYSEGFNPKPKMVFAAPLSIGTESRTEFMDLRLTERVPEGDIFASLNRNLTDDMRVEEVYYPETKLTELKWFSYTICITTDGADAELAETCRRALLGDKVLVNKKTKPGEPVKTVDVRPLIRSVEAVASGGEIRISACFSADQSAFLNPEYAVEALRKSAGVLSSGDLLREHYSIMRECAYFGDMRPFR